MSAMLVEGRRQWVQYETLWPHVDNFGATGQAVDAARPLEVPHISGAEVRLLKQRALVDLAVTWMEHHRDLRS